jgi:CBS domain-containing protein
MQYRPMVPLNFLGEVSDRAEQDGDGIDLKKYGSRIFVDAARIFALASGGSRSVNTAERLNVKLAQAVGFAG